MSTFIKIRPVGARLTQAEGGQTWQS